LVESGQIYRCESCGIIVEVIHAGPGGVRCCGQDMMLLEEKMQDEGMEKHVPVIEKTDEGFKVKVGSVQHPMEESHHIKMIEIIADNVVYRKLLQPGQVPVAEFCIKADKVAAREYCNLHGLWRS